MLRRVSRGLGHTAKQAQKVHLKLDVEKLDNLPAAVKNCRVVWSRGPKVQMTNIKDVAKGKQERLTRCCWLHCCAWAPWLHPCANSTNTNTALDLLECRCRGLQAAAQPNSYNVQRRQGRL
jgi:hypothetical protein